MHPCLHVERCGCVQVQAWFTRVLRDECTSCCAGQLLPWPRGHALSSWCALSAVFDTHASGSPFPDCKPDLTQCDGTLSPHSVRMLFELAAGGKAFSDAKRGQCVYALLHALKAQPWLRGIYGVVSDGTEFEVLFVPNEAATPHRVTNCGRFDVVKDRAVLWKLLHMGPPGAEKIDLSLDASPDVADSSEPLRLERFLGSGANFVCYAAKHARTEVAVLLARSAEDARDCIQAQADILRECAAHGVEGVLRVYATGPRVLVVTPVLEPLQFPRPLRAGDAPMLVDTLQGLHRAGLYAGELDFDHVHMNGRPYVFDFSFPADVQRNAPNPRRRLALLSDAALQHIVRTKTLRLDNVDAEYRNDLHALVKMVFVILKGPECLGSLREAEAERAWAPERVLARWADRWPQDPEPVWHVLRGMAERRDYDGLKKRLSDLV